VRRRTDRGSAVVAAVLTLPIVTAIFLVVVQLAVTAYLRSNVVHAASEAARAASVSSNPVAVADQRARAVLRATSGVAHLLSVRTQQQFAGGVAVVNVVVTVAIPGMWLSGSQQISGSALAVQEPAP